MLAATIEGIGLLGPGLNGWTQGRQVFMGDIAHASSATEFPVATSLPPSERRRASRATKLVLAVGLEASAAAGLDASSLATVFASSGGDGYNCHEICQMLASNDRQLSPTRFHNSVHNAPAGYWSIASGSMAPSSVICAHDASFGAGLLEAMSQVTTTGERCLLIAYDTDYPQPIRVVRPVPDAFGIALVLNRRVAGSGNRALATIELQLTHSASESLGDPSLENLRRAIPAARGLPILEAITGEAPRTVVIDYLDDIALSITVTP